MLSTTPDRLRTVPDSRQRPYGLSAIISRYSSSLAACNSSEIEKTIYQSIADVAAIEHAQQAGWFTLNDSGALVEIFRSAQPALAVCSVLRNGLQRLPWCLAQLYAGKAVLLFDTQDLLPEAAIEGEFLRKEGIRSLALLPSRSVALGLTVLVLSSNSVNTIWSDRLVEQGTLLVDIFSNAYQRGITQSVTALLHSEELVRKDANDRAMSLRQAEVDLLTSLLIQSQENERKRISRELHDGIGQRLSLVTSEVALLASQPVTPDFVTTDRLEALRDELDGICTDIHEMSHNLHSFKLQHLGLKCALNDLCRKLSHPDFCVHLHADDLEEPISAEVSLCLYRVAQESLNNALKHARAPEAAVCLTKLQGTFYMAIQDTGIGMDSGKKLQGLGLVSMRERLKLLDGQFKIHSHPGRGTEIWIAVPDRAEFVPTPPCSHRM